MIKVKKMARFLMAASVLLICFSGKAMAAQPQESALYGIGSVSKMFGAAAVMLLADRGLVELDAPVTDYIPEFEMADGRYRQITVRMLLNHSSGIMGTTYRNCFLLGEPDTDYQTMLLDSLKHQELKAEPGEYSVYCNDGYTLAEMVVERVSGISFAQFVREEFSIPLNMEQTCMPGELTGTEKLAPVYFNHRRLPYENIRSLASGGIYSTAGDLCRFARIFAEEGAGILSGQAVEAMSCPEYLDNKIGVQEGDSNFGYGLGWDCVEAFPFSKYGIKVLTKGGDTGNYSAGLLVAPEYRLSAAVTASGGSSEQCLLMAQEIITEVLLEEGLISELQVTRAAPPEIAEGIETDKEVQGSSEAKSAKEAGPGMEGAKEAAVIPEEMKRYEGIYASGEIWRLEFTDQNTARITSLENDSDMVQEYVYTQSGSFISTEGKYISYNGLAQTADGISGLTSFSFREEQNGKTYMLGTTYRLVNGKAQSAVTQPFAEKLEVNTMSEETARIWEKRDGRKYYLVNDAFHSASYLRKQMVRVELMKAFPGYTCAGPEYKNCRIIDGDNAVCELDLPIMTGRDLADFHFYQEDGAEYLEIGDYVYIDGEAVPELTDAIQDVTLGAAGQWLRIKDRAADCELRISIPRRGAYYVYDENDALVTSSILEGERDSVLLPGGGSLLLVGEEGSTFTLLWPGRTTATDLVMQASAAQ